MSADLAILPVCYCTAHDGPHVHLPHMVDSQYGLSVHLAEEHVALGITRVRAAPAQRDATPGADARGLPDGTLVTCDLCNVPHPKGDDGRVCRFPKVAASPSPSGNPGKDAP
jgi:hypothetical protein